MAPSARLATSRFALRTVSLAIFAQRHHHVGRYWAFSLNLKRRRCMDRSRGEPSSVRLQRAGLISVSDFAFGTALRRDYADGHKSPMRVCPSQGFVSRFEESINYQRVSFRGAPAMTAS